MCMWRFETRFNRHFNGTHKNTHAFWCSFSVSIFDRKKCVFPAKVVPLPFSLTKSYFFPLKCQLCIHYNFRTLNGAIDQTKSGRGGIQLDSWLSHSHSDLATDVERCFPYVFFRSSFSSDNRLMLISNLAFSRAVSSRTLRASANSCSYI